MVGGQRQRGGLVTWEWIAKGLLGAVLGWAAYEVREMRTAVYAGQTRSAVLEQKVETIDTRVKHLEAKVFKHEE
jgi:hypothetical protein